MNNLLIIFVKNPIRGQVKTRLAKDIGDDKALIVYRTLLKKTHQITQPLSCTKWVMYSDRIEKNDIWQAGFEKHLQQGKDLGARMLNAFETGFDQAFDNICIIGSDCFELTTQIIASAFDTLDHNEFVIGPAFDGGYYLLGMKSLHKALFAQKDWSTSSVLNDTIKDIEATGKNLFKLPVLSDIDELRDLKNFPEIIF